MDFILFLYKFKVSEWFQKSTVHFSWERIKFQIVVPNKSS